MPALPPALVGWLAQMRRLLTYAPLVVALIAALAAGFVPLSYYSLGPGPAREVEPLIHVVGRQTFPSDGRLIMTTVEFRQLTAIGSLLAWINPEEAVVSRDALYPPGQTTQQEERTSISQMDQSKIDATSVVLSELEGYPKDHGSGSLIRQTVQGCSADGKLFPGDLVLRINGAPIADGKAASSAIKSIPSGKTLSFQVRPLGTSHMQRIRLVRQPCGGSKQPLVGVSMTDNFPFQVSISSGDVGGPSAGLMWALGLYDALTPGDLTDGRTIAGTGTIDPMGNVGPIGGIEEKVLAAHKTGASELLVPLDDMAGARAAAEPGLRLVPIGTFDQAVAFLERQGGTAPAPGSTPKPIPSP
jgi:PDZ domain-containing protein